MTLVELGAALRIEREKRGLDMEDAANKLKISARLLRALEEGDETSLPPLAYTKGFIRSYASYVGLSAEEVSEALGALEAASEPVAPQNVYEPEMVLTPRRNLKPILAGLFMVCVIAVVMVAWQQGVFDFLSRQTRRLAQPAPLQSAESVDPGNLASRPSAPAAQGQAPVQTSAQGSAQAPAVASQSQGSAAPAQGQTPAQATAQNSAQNSAQTSAQASAQSASQPAAPGLPPVRGTAASAPVANAPAAAPASTAPTAPAASAAAPAAASQGSEVPVGAHKLIITATEECWMHSSADKTDTRQFSLHKGDTFALTFSKSLELKLGNAGGVRLRYDGEELPPAGQSGQVRNLVFPPADRP